MKKIFVLLSAVFSLCACSENKEQKEVSIPSIAGFLDGIHHWNLLHEVRDYQRLDTTQYEAIADNLIAYQNADGGWMKNIDWLGVLNADSVINELDETYKQSTLDNRNTFPQIEYLAQVYCITGNEVYLNGSKRGLEYLLNTQKRNGGWRGWDVDAITFNDEVTTGALHLFQRIIYGDSTYQWVDDATMARIKDGYNRGMEMILKCQVIQDGVKTAWAQQYDNETLLPCGARTFELAGLTANECCPIIDLLMDVRDPSQEVIDAVDAAIVWLNKVAIKGIRIEEIPLAKEDQFNHEYPFDRVVVEDENARPIWARFYELEDNTPFFCRRDGVKVSSLAEVNGERRTGYDWYGYWPEDTLARYQTWKANLK